MSSAWTCAVLNSMYIRPAYVLLIFLLFVGVATLVVYSLYERNQTALSPENVAVTYTATSTSQTNQPGLPSAGGTGGTSGGTGTTPPPQVYIVAPQLPTAPTSNATPPSSMNEDTVVVSSSAPSQMTVLPGTKNIEVLRFALTAPARTVLVTEMAIGSDQGNRAFNYLENARILRRVRGEDARRRQVGTPDCRRAWFARRRARDPHELRRRLQRGLDVSRHHP